MTAFRCEAETVWVNASTGFGSVGLYVPFDAHVRATGSVGHGQLSLGARLRARGVEVAMSRELRPEFGDGATIVADLEAGIGDVYISREWLPKRQRDKACR